MFTHLLLQKLSREILIQSIENLDCKRFLRFYFNCMLYDCIRSSAKQRSGEIWTSVVHSPTRFVVKIEFDNQEIKGYLNLPKVFPTLYSTLAPFRGNDTLTFCNPPATFQIQSEIEIFRWVSKIPCRFSQICRQRSFCICRSIPYVSLAAHDPIKK